MKRPIAAFLPVFSIVCAIFAANAAPSTARPSVNMRAPTMSANVGGTGATAPASAKPIVPAIPKPEPEAAAPAPEPAPIEKNSATCREAYRDCMDQFCLLDATEGERCACSSNIEKSKPILKEINTIQTEAEKLFGEGVEYEKLGAKAVLVFRNDKKSTRAKIDFNSWVFGGASRELDGDNEIGDELFGMAQDACADRLAACGKDAQMEETLYSRMVTNDCKTFNAFLEDQKKIATQNRSAAEKAVRAARFDMLGTTNKFNRGECLLAFKGCIADKGGCGQNFENCLDAELLGSRAHACNNILDQCMAVRPEVEKDWKAESVRVLADAQKYSEHNQRNTCRARVRACLEDHCSISYDIKSATDAGCLTDIKVAKGTCPVIQECIDLLGAGVSGGGKAFENVVKGQLAELRIAFCQNDVAACFQDKCGADFTKPECLGMPWIGTGANKGKGIADLCPRKMFMSCNSLPNDDQFDIIQSAAALQFNHQQLVGCANYFAEKLGDVCGTDMNCLPPFTAISNARNIEQLRSLDRLTTPDADAYNRESIATKRQSLFTQGAFMNTDEATPMQRFVRNEVTARFDQLSQDSIIKECGERVGESVFTTAKMLAVNQADDNIQLQFLKRMGELGREQTLADGKKECGNIEADRKKVNSATDMSANKSGVWVTGTRFDPILCNCEVTRVQKVCATGGQTKGMGAVAGLTAGAGAGTAAMPGWGTLIGAAGGALAGGLLSKGMTTDCDTITVTENVPVCNPSATAGTYEAVAGD